DRDRGMEADPEPEAAAPGFRGEGGGLHGLRRARQRSLRGSAPRAGIVRSRRRRGTRGKRRGLGGCLWLRRCVGGCLIVGGLARLRFGGGLTVGGLARLHLGGSLTIGSLA